LISRDADYVKHRFTRSYDFGGNLGERDVEIIVFKSDETVEQDDDLSLRSVKQRKFISNNKQQERAVFFTVNGQVHGDKGLSFIKNRCDKYHTGKDTVAFVDFSDLGPAGMIDLFTPARDRLQDKPTAKRLESGMQDILTNDKTLVEEERKRREQFTQDKREEKMGDVLDELVERNPALKDFLEEGDKAGSGGSGDAGNSIDHEEFEAPFLPSKLVPLDRNGELWEQDERYEVEQPVNRNGYIAFYLDAPNDFFTRSEKTGTMLIEPNSMVQSHGLDCGRWGIQLKPLALAEPGMTFGVEVSVGAAGMEGLTSEFEITYTEPVEDDDGTGGKNDNGRASMSELDFPEIYGVYEDEWDEHKEHFDKHTPVRIAGSGSDMTLYVNYDAAPIKDFMRRYNLRKTGKEMVKETWKVGVAMYALSSYIEVEEEFDPERVDPDHIAEVSMRGIVQSMLDQQISDEELEALTA
jgi:hypothetical protein